jgi:methyl-accepting chemotaxis protein/sensor domain CHASE-containing protein
MTLAWKKNLLILGITLVIVSGLIGISNVIFSNSFGELETRDTTENTTRAVNALTSAIQSLDILNFNWSAWDDTYAFVSDHNQAYLDSNTTDSSFINANLNLILIADNSGKVIYTKCFDLLNNQEIPVTQEINDKIAVSAILDHDNVESSVIGIVSLTEYPMIISSRPIIHSDGQGPVAGTIIMGQYLDDVMIKSLSATTKLPITIAGLSGESLLYDFQNAVNHLKEPVDVFVKPLNSRTIAGYSIIKDVSGQPVLILRAEKPRDIFAQGQATLRFFIYFIIGLGIIVAAVIILLFNRIDATRKRQMEEHARITHITDYMIAGLKSNARQLSAASAELVKAAGSSSQSTQQVAANSQQMAKGAQEQSVSAQETARSIERLTSMIKQMEGGAQTQMEDMQKAAADISTVSSAISQVAENSRSASQGAEKAAQTAKEGAEKASLTVNGMDHIKKSSDQLAEKIAILGNRSNEIGKIVAVIDDIASQTNLLALNAAIEAARAGEQGRGFAVVSDEVRKLAERTASSTQEISELITSIQKEVAEATRVTLEAGNIITNGYNMAVETGQSLNQIMQSADNVNEQIKMISDRTQLVNGSTNNIVNIIDNLSQVTQQNSSSARQMGENAGQISKAIETMASIAEENSAATEQVSASTQEMISHINTIVLSIQSLKDMAASIEEEIVKFEAQKTSESFKITKNRKKRNTPLNPPLNT